MAYIYDWLLLDKNAKNPTKDITGFIGTAEYRAYFSNGFYIGPYLQYKSVECAGYAMEYYDYIQSTMVTKRVTISKNAAFGGFLSGYQFKMSKRTGSEFQINLGMSRKQLFQNGTPVERVENPSESAFMLIDQTGRYPQFAFTYKLYVVIGHK